ncbi:unnamed protein product [Cuscuta campestris]|uniref:Glutaredoxin domain-containing protein n=1 Tax=Cuscuta campestris TaxID=132261 RepID=A0A484M5I9_9ASTE|nr:unnamed protein product [Cuscuta campestris]
MQKAAAIPNQTWPIAGPLTSTPPQMSGASDPPSPQTEDLRKTVAENAVIVFGRRGCCMIHVAKRLLHGLGANPAIYEADEGRESDLIKALEDIGDYDPKDGRLQFPAVFVGGRLFGGLDRVIGAHITGELTPVLKEAGALWL